MRKIAVYIFAVFVLLVMMVSCGGNSGPGRKQGEIYGECFKDNTCNEGLICDTEHNICVRDEDYSDDTEPDDDEAYDAEADLEDVDSENVDEPEDDDAIYEETLPKDVFCLDYKCRKGKSYCGYKDGGEMIWVKIENCAFSECIASTGKCGCDSSEDGEIHCESDKLHICSNGKWQIREQCKAGCDSATDSCKPWEDPDSGMEWSSESNAMVWEDAVDYCDKLSEGGYSDWRLPSISEARTLINACHGTRTGDRCGVTDSCLSTDCLNYNCNLCEPKSDGYYSKIDSNHTSWNLLWSASEVSGREASAWGIELYTGSIAEKVKNEYGVARCVRGDNHRQLCEGLPEHAFWNSASNIFSTWDGSSWQPSLTGVYNETSSEKECRFKCIPGYKWDGYKCIPSDDLPECSPESPTPCKDYSSGLVWSSKSSKLDWREAVDYCFRHSENVGKVWFVPTIDELRTLVKKCSKAEYGGICMVSEDKGFLSVYDVGDRKSCFCNEKGSEPEEYNKFGDSGLLWSSSVCSDNPDSVWCVFNGIISYGAGSYNGVEIMNPLKTYEYGTVRCVAR